jgi:hypothetical protein
VQTIVVLISAYALNRTDNKRREAEESRRLMLDELDHRVKNTLASVVAMCEQTLGSVKSMEEFRAAFIGRVHAMARAHEALASRRWDGVSIRELVETTVAPFATSGRSSFRLDGDEAVLPAARRCRWRRRCTSLRQMRRSMGRSLRAAAVSAWNGAGRPMVAWTSAGRSDRPSGRAHGRHRFIPGDSGRRSSAGWWRTS